MKQLLAVVTDTFLLFFLFIIFLVPILVSFNLDPKLYKGEDNAGAKVAGVSNNNLSSNFYLDYYSSSEDRVFFEKAEKSENSVFYNLKVAKGSPIDTKIPLGKITNGDDQKTISFNSFDYKNSCQGCILKYYIGESTYSPSKISEVQIPPQSEKEFGLLLTTSGKVNYDGELTIRIEVF